MIRPRQHVFVKVMLGEPHSLLQGYSLHWQGKGYGGCLLNLNTISHSILLEKLLGWVDALLNKKQTARWPSPKGGGEWSCKWCTPRLGPDLLSISIINDLDKGIYVPSVGLQMTTGWMGELVPWEHKEGSIHCVSSQWKGVCRKEVLQVLSPQVWGHDKLKAGWQLCMKQCRDSPFPQMEMSCVSLTKSFSQVLWVYHIFCSLRDFAKHILDYLN